VSDFRTADNQENGGRERGTREGTQHKPGK